MSSNVSDLRPSGDPVRLARAKYVHGLLRAERWSVRAAAVAMGITNSVLATRMSGATPFLADELEGIARLLKQDPVAFYSAYLSAGASPDNGPASPSNDLKHSTDLAETVSLAPVTPIRRVG